MTFKAKSLNNCYQTLFSPTNSIQMHPQIGQRRVSMINNLWTKNLLRLCVKVPLPMSNRHSRIHYTHVNILQVRKSWHSFSLNIYGYYHSTVSFSGSQNSAFSTTSLNTSKVFPCLFYAWLFTKSFGSSFYIQTLYCSNGQNNNKGNEEKLFPERYLRFWNSIQHKNYHYIFLLIFFKQKRPGLKLQKWICSSA